MLFKKNAMKIYADIEVYLQIFLTQQLISLPGPLYVLAKSPGIHCMRGRVSALQGFEPQFCSSELPKTLYILSSPVYHIFTQYSAVRHEAHVRCCSKLSVYL